MRLRKDHTKIKLILSGILFIVSIFVYLINENSLKYLFNIIWIVVLLEYLFVFSKHHNKFRPSNKIYEINYSEIESYNENRYKAKKRSNLIGIILSTLIWIAYIVVLLIFDSKKLLNYSHYYLIFFFLYFLDIVFISYKCPFRYFIFKNKCCTTCPIYNWGQSMVTTVLFFIPSFFTYSLGIVAVLILLQSQYQYVRFPKRFYEETNKNLKCSTCERICTKKNANK